MNEVREKNYDVSFFMKQKHVVQRKVVKEISDPYRSTHIGEIATGIRPESLLIFPRINRYSLNIQAPIIICRENQNFVLSPKFTQKTYVLRLGIWSKLFHWKCQGRFLNSYASINSFLLSFLFINWVVRNSCVIN